METSVQGARYGVNVSHAATPVPASPRLGPPPPPPGFSANLPAPEVQHRSHPLHAFAQPPPPPPASIAAPPNGPHSHPAPSPWQQSPLAGQQSLFSQQPLDTSRMAPGFAAPNVAMPPRAQIPAGHAPAHGAAAAAPLQRGPLGQAPGTPRSWQGATGTQQPQQLPPLSRAAQEQLDCAARQSLDSQQRPGSLGGPSREGSRRQSLESAPPGSLASHASTGCASEAGSLANTPRTTLADTSSSLFAHAPFPASPSHAAAASAMQLAAGQPAAAYPGASRLSGRPGSFFGGAYLELAPAEATSGPELGSVPGLQHANLAFGSGSLQLTPSHFGTNVSANTGNGECPTRARRSV